jgi:hypothetical protein
MGDKIEKLLQVRPVGMNSMLRIALFVSYIVQKPILRHPPKNKKKLYSKYTNKITEIKFLLKKNIKNENY